MVKKMTEHKLYGECLFVINAHMERQNCFQKIEINCVHNITFNNINEIVS